MLEASIPRHYHASLIQSHAERQTLGLLYTLAGRTALADYRVVMRTGGTAERINLSLCGANPHGIAGPNGYAASRFRASSAFRRSSRCLRLAFCLIAQSKSVRSLSK